MRLKHSLACPRPVGYSTQVQPFITTPRHGSLPSGHASEAFIVATVLWKLMEDAGHPIYGTNTACEHLMRLASRMAINRTIAGVHFPVDSVAGSLLGLTLGHYLFQRCTKKANYQARVFDGSAFPAAPTADFDWRALFSVPSSGTPTFATNATYAPAPTTQSLDGWHSALLRRLWKKAK